MIKRIRNILLVLACFIFFVHRGSARKSVVAKKFVIIYLTNNIGDMVCVTPVFAAIKEHNPSLSVTIIGSKINSDLLSSHPFVDHYIVCPKSALNLVKIVREGCYDAGLVINPSAPDLATLFLGNVKSISCLEMTHTYAHMVARPYRVVSKLAHRIPYTPGVYIPRILLELLKPFGIEDSYAKKVLTYNSEIDKTLDSMLLSNGLLKNQPFIAIAPGAGSDLKRWPAERFSQVAEYLYREHALVPVFIGGPNDLDIVSECIQNFSSRVVYYNPGPLSMEMLKAMLSRAILLIGNDSGAVHVAEAVGTATIAVVGSTDDTEHFESGKHHAIVRSVSKKNGVYQAYIGDEQKIDTEWALEQMEAVTVEDVVKTADKILFTETERIASVTKL
jgi:heptosyltransferase I